MKKIIGLMLAALLLCGCAGLAPLDESFDEDWVEERAAEVVALTNAGDYEGVCRLLRPDLAETIDAASLEAAWADTLAASGAFVEIARIRLGGADDANTGESYAVALVYCRYRQGLRVYTLSFDRDGALVGLYLK